MTEILFDFIQKIPQYSDGELIFASMYDAALAVESESDFDLLANRIFEEIIERDLTVDHAIKAREFVHKISKRISGERLRNTLSEVRRGVMQRGPLYCAPTYDEIMEISRQLNEYQSESTGFRWVLERDVTLPYGYFWNQNHHLIYRNAHGKAEIVYPGEIKISRILINRKKDPSIPQKAEICFDCDGEEKIQIMTLKELYNSSSLQHLANYGAFVNDENSRLLAKYFSDYVTTFRSSIDRGYTTQQVGWQDDDYKDFVPYSSNYVYDCTRYQNEYLSILQSRGSFHEWASLIKPFRDNEHIPFRIILATSFASVLARPLMNQPFFLNIHGRSQLGKTPSLIVAASPWANPSNESGYINEMSGSDEALELGAHFYGSLPYCLNESQHRVVQSKEATLDKLIHLLGEGRPKPRGSGTGGIQVQSSWCNAIILTGEENLAGKSDKLGVRVRALDLHVTDFIISQDDKTTESLCRGLLHQYNTAGPEFVRRLISDDGMAEANSLNDYYRDKIPGNIEKRQRHIAATILTADTLIAKWIFEDSICLTVDDILPYLKTKPDESVKNDNESAQKVIDEWLRTELGEDFSKKSSKGRILKGTSIFVLFDDNVLVELLRTNGYNIDDYCKWAKANGKLAANEKNGYKRGVNRTKSDPKHSGHLYALVLPLSS